MDAVITYVNCNENFIQEYEKYVQKELEEERYRSYDTLDLQIKLIRKYLPFVKNIFIVVSNKEQVEGIDISDAIVITHEDIIPSKYLPCFNSCTIEMFFHKIPNLSEEFIYFNDDVFPIDYLRPTDFFIYHKPLYNPKTYTLEKDNDKLYLFNLNNSTVLAAKILRKENDYKDKYIKYAHSTIPLLKSSYELTWQFEKNQILASLTRTRHRKNYNTTLFNNYNYLLDKFIHKDVGSTYLNLASGINKIIDTILYKPTPIVCINDVGEYSFSFDTFKKELRNAFEMNLLDTQPKKEEPKKVEVKKEIKEKKKEVKVEIKKEEEPKKQNTIIQTIKNISNNIFNKEVVKPIEDKKEEINDEPKEELVKVSYKISKEVEKPKEEVKEKEIKEEDNKKIDKSPIIITDKLIVSFTSWTKRIQYCKHTIDLMMNQTIIPDKIILNLSEEEFPNKEYDLPKDILVEIIKNPLFEIYWVKENTTVWKKIIPTMNRFPNDLVFSIDDDIEYPSNYIEEMYRTYCENNKLYPVVAYGNGKNNIFSHSGPFSLTSKKFYGKYIDEIFNELIYPSIRTKKWQSDIFYTYSLLLNNGRYKRCRTIDGKLLYDNSDLNKKNAYSAYNYKDYKTFNIIFNENKKALSTFVKNKYNVENIFFNSTYECIISLTCWKNRINDVYKTIQNLLSFIDTRFKIVLTLSSDELSESDLPKNLTALIGDKFEILWVKKNYKVFKKILFTMKKYPLCPIISADDDAIYKFNYVIELFNEWKNDKNTIITSLRENKWTINGEDYYFAHGCATIYPPSILLGALKYIDNKNILNTNNDDSFYGIYAKFNNINIKYLGHHINDTIEFHTNVDALTYKTKNQMDKFLSDKKIIISELWKS